MASGDRAALRRAGALAPAALAAVGLAACGGAPLAPGPNSIVGLKPELRNGSFDDGPIAPWEVFGARWATITLTPQPTWDGGESAVVRASGRMVTGSVVLRQSVAAGDVRGTRYRLRLRAR